jgi:hypothetical protein
MTRGERNELVGSRNEEWTGSHKQCCRSLLDEGIKSHVDIGISASLDFHGDRFH